MEKVIMFEHISFVARLKSMLKVDFRRIFTQPLVYIILGVSLLVPVLILIMTTMMGGPSVDPVTGEEIVVETFTNVWQAISSVSGASSSMSMDLTSMCNMNLNYFFVAVFVCIFVADDFRSGYAKNLFTIRAKRTEYVISKSLIGFVGGAGMMVFYFIGAMIGGAISGLSFEMDGFNSINLVACFLSKVFLVPVFSAIFLLLAVVGKQRLWLSIVGSFAVVALIFMIIPMMTPLNADILNVILCFAGGVILNICLGAVSNIILKKTSLV